jgi:hypothetical protein
VAGIIAIRVPLRSGTARREVSASRNYLIRNGMSFREGQRKD